VRRDPGEAGVRRGDDGWCDSALQKAVLDRIIQIAAEGRKYGLWLLLSTQRPAKVHQGIISQCDNLALMRMSSQRDLDELATIFAFAPTAMLAESPLFDKVRRCSPEGSRLRRVACPCGRASPTKEDATSQCRFRLRPLEPAFSPGSDSDREGTLR
jgi:hypothetical protein